MVEHAVEVSASSLYEAVALGLRAFHAAEWVGEIGRGLTTLNVAIKRDEVKHSVSVKDFERWLSQTGTTPAQQLAKERVREILHGKPMR